MQIVHIEVTPVSFQLRAPLQAASGDQVENTAAVFIRIDTRQGEIAWGCAAVDPSVSTQSLEEVTQVCHDCADRARDLNPLNLEFALAELSDIARGTPAAQCAFDTAFHDLLGLAAGQPLHRLLGGFRHRIQTSITISVASVTETVALAHHHASHGFRILKIKGGQNPGEDVERVKAVRRALPSLTLRLDADQGYSIQEALEVARALKEDLEMLEQPTAANDLETLGQVTSHSPVPILADESVGEPASALEIASRRAAHGMSIKLATCGGLHCGRQVDAVARAARLTTMVGCTHEPALLIAAGLMLALSSPNVQYGDLDGHLDLIDDPTLAGFLLEDGWLIATDVPGLGCTVDL